VFENARIVAVIPARGGSKALPGKNVRPLGGRPLITWTIDAARGCPAVDRIVVSTDDEVIAAAARAAGASVPFLRPAELATDTARSIDVVLHALDRLAADGEPFDVVVLLQPTSPLRTAADVGAALDLLFGRKAQAVVSVCETEHHPWWSNTLPPDGSLAWFLRPEVLNANRQQLPVFYRLNGAVYAGRCDYVRAQGGFFGPDTLAYKMPRERSVDIDTLLDFKLAELLLQEGRA
jgi:N-acylneuraminate cytidylyltransferase/CMP-N,N'-diacetyllegionaminic acid synthase